MGFSAHRGTPGHTIGMQVIGKDNPPGTGKMLTSNAGAGGGHNLSHLSMEFGANGGVSVTHRMKPPSGSKKDKYDPSLEQIHMFRDSQEAHHHIGGLLGLRMGSGEQKE